MKIVGGAALPETSGPAGASGPGGEAPAERGAGRRYRDSGCVSQKEQRAQANGGCGGGRLALGWRGDEGRCRASRDQVSILNKLRNLDCKLPWGARERIQLDLHFRELPDSSEGQRLREAGPPWEARWGQGDARETVVWRRGTDLVLAEWEAEGWQSLHPGGGPGQEGAGPASVWILWGHPCRGAALAGHDGQGREVPRGPGQGLWDPQVGAESSQRPPRGWRGDHKMHAGFSSQAVT